MQQHIARQDNPTPLRTKLWGQKSQIVNKLLKVIRKSTATAKLKPDNINSIHLNNSCHSAYCVPEEFNSSHQ